MYTQLRIYTDERDGVDAHMFILTVKNYAQYDGLELDQEDEEFIVNAYLNHDWDSCKTYHELTLNK